MFDKVGYVRFVVRADKDCAEYPDDVGVARPPPLGNLGGRDVGCDHDATSARIC